MKIAPLKLKLHLGIHSIHIDPVFLICHTLCWLLKIKWWARKEIISLCGAHGLLGKRVFHESTEEKNINLQLLEKVYVICKYIYPMILCRMGHQAEFKTSKWVIIFQSKWREEWFLVKRESCVKYLKIIDQDLQWDWKRRKGFVHLDPL